MTDIVDNTISSRINEQTAQRISELCDLILVTEDQLDFERSQKYIEMHLDDDINLYGSKVEIRSIVQNNIIQYIRKCPMAGQLFAFASDNNYHRFRKFFYEYYHQHCCEKSKPRESFVFPEQLDYVFDCIQEAIDFHTLHENFTIKMADDAIDRAKKEAMEASHKAAQAAKLSAKQAELAASNAANKAVENAIEQVFNEKQIEMRISNSVDCQMNKVTSKVSETSVTILGIFAGIVLTVVAGLFYSSSVLENINSANINKLVLVASLVGFVCVNIIAVMFNYIDKFRSNYNSNSNPTSTDQKNKNDTSLINRVFKRANSHLFVIIVDIVLVCTIIISACTYDYAANENLNDFEQTNSNISMDINISQSDSSNITSDEKNNSDIEDVDTIFTTSAAPVSTSTPITSNIPQNTTP